MELTPVVELQIRTSSANCEIGANNICHYNVGQQLNLDIDKQLYIAVKDVKVPSLEREIEFYYYYGKKQVFMPDGHFPDNLMKKCILKFNSFQDLATMLMKVANKQLKPLFDKNPPKSSIFSDVLQLLVWSPQAGRHSCVRPVGESSQHFNNCCAPHC